MAFPVIHFHCRAIILSVIFDHLISYFDSVEYFWEELSEEIKEMLPPVFANFKFFSWKLGWTGDHLKREGILVAQAHTIKWGIIWHLHSYLLFFQTLVFKDTMGTRKNVICPSLGNTKGSREVVSNLKLEGCVSSSQTWKLIRVLGKRKAQKGDCALKATLPIFPDSSAVENDDWSWYCCDTEEDLNQFISNIKYKQWKNFIR